MINKTIWKTVKWTLSIMISFMVLVLIMFMLTTVRAFQNLPVVGRYKPMVVLSGSMEPGIKVGSVVLVAAVNPDDIKVDDIITFPLPRERDNQEPANTTHRVTRVIADSGGLRFITKGDANDTVDNWEVAGDEVIGRAIFSIAYLGYLGNFVRMPAGFLILIILPVLVILTFEIRNIVSELRLNKGPAL